jgi:hypothetical protein
MKKKKTFFIQQFDTVHCCAGGQAVNIFDINNAAFCPNGAFTETWTVEGSNLRKAGSTFVAGGYDIVYIDSNFAPLDITKTYNLSFDIELVSAGVLPLSLYIQLQGAFPSLCPDIYILDGDDTYINGAAQSANANAYRTHSFTITPAIFNSAPTDTSNASNCSAVIHILFISGFYVDCDNEYIIKNITLTEQ